jgi:hypothetical protein
VREFCLKGSGKGCFDAFPSTLILDRLDVRADFVLLGHQCTGHDLFHDGKLHHLNSSREMVAHPAAFGRVTWLQRSCASVETREYPKIMPLGCIRNLHQKSPIGSGA